VDDAPNTIEIDDRYVILPAVSPYWPEERFSALRAKGGACGQDFQYSSDQNSEWLQPQDLRDWLAR
jgi:hypothetical protein